MKSNDYLLLTATLGYSYLFYEQNAGINFLILVILFAGILLIRNPKLLSRPKWLWALGLCMVSSISVVVNSSALAIIGTCFSLLLVSAFSFNTRTSSIFAFLFSFYSVASSMVWVIIDAVTRSSSKNQESMESSAGKKGYKAFAIIAVFILCIIFFVLYKQANPLFAENTKWINLDFISLSWVVFTAGGFLLVYPLFYHKTISPIESWENNLPLQNRTALSNTGGRIETERFAGMVLFLFLNMMLIVLNAGDISTIWGDLSLPKGITHSDFVHNGVGMIILSIIIATALIMFLYRKDFDELKKSKALKFLIYLWIVQNLIMLFSTAFRNQIYIHTYNFTYKRIGVYFWLGLAAAGLIITFVKMLNNKSNWFLVRSNFAIWFTVLSLSSTLNWDLIITKFNLKNKPLKDVDLYYLFSLSDTNIPELLEVTKHKDFGQIKDHVYNRSCYYERSYPDLLNAKIYHYMRDYTADWQSRDLRDARIINTIIKH